MNIYSTIIIIVFVIVNISILWSDISHQKIKNNTLLLLIAILPFWYSIFPYWSSAAMITQALFSVTLILFGIFFYTENGFLGSGDIKYWAILILFLGHHSLAMFVGNIGILTIITLMLWWSMILGQIYAIHGKARSIMAHMAIPKLEQKAVISWILLILLDWVVIGFFISLFIKDITLRIFEIIPPWEDFYFLITIYIFVLRPGLRYMITKWKYKILPILGILVYFGAYIQKNGITAFLWENMTYIQYIWIYAFIFYIVSTLTQTTFSHYDTITMKKWIKNTMHSMPYSVIIFGWFIALVLLNISLFPLLKGFW